MIDSSYISKTHILYLQTYSNPDNKLTKTISNLGFKVFDHNDICVYMTHYRQIEKHDTLHVSQLQQPDIIREQTPV